LKVPDADNDPAAAVIPSCSATATK